MRRFQNVIAKHNGRLVGLTGDGEIYEQRREGNGIIWRPVDPPEDAGRIVSIATKTDGLLIVVNSRGAVYQQQGDGMLGSKPEWQPVDMAGLDAA